MRCDEFRVRLDQLLDKRLDPERDWMLTSHANDCEACESELSGQQLLCEAIDLFDPPALSDSFANEVSAVVLRERQSFRRKKSRVFWFAGIAVAASLLVGFFALDFAFWRDNAQDRVGDRAVERARPRVTSPKTRQNERFALSQGMLPKSEPQARDLTPRASVPSTSDLRSLRYIESDEIPGVRPLKTSFGVTISLLKQTIPGRHSSAPKQPATSQVATQWWYAV